MAVRFWKVGPERPLLIPVHAEVQNTNTHIEFEIDRHEIFITGVANQDGGSGVYLGSSWNWYWMPSP